MLHPRPDDDPFSFNLDVDDDDGDEDKAVDDSLDLPLLDPSDLNPLSSHTSAALAQDMHPHISKHGNKLKLKLSKSHSSNLIHDPTSSYFPNTTSASASSSSAAAASLAFSHHPATLLTLLPKPSTAFDADELKALAKDLHALQRESKLRALLIEGELRKLYDGDGGGIESEEYYQNALKWLHGIDVSDDFLGSDDAAGGAVVEQRRKKHGKKGDDDDEADGTKRKNKKKNRNQSTTAGDGDEEEEVDSDDESKPKKAMTAKEKQAALRDFWESVDGWMAFPTMEQCDSVRETEWRGLDIGPPSSYWMKEGKEREWREEKERERDREREKEKEKEREKDRADAHKDPKKRKKEKKKEKERREKERERDKHKDAKKLAEANRLSLFFIDDAKTRRSVIDTDRALAGINGTNGSSISGGNVGGGGGGSGGLVSRVMGIFVEQVGKVLPYMNPAIKGKAAGSANKKQKKDNNKQRSSITPPQFTLEERLRMELKSVGLLSGADVDLAADYAHRADDELCAALRSHSASLSQAVAGNNGVRRMLHPLSLRLVDHTQRLQLLYEAEATLHKSYKKKKLSDNKCKEVVEQFVTQQQRLGNRRRITGFIPHPADMKGVPRVIADSVLSHPSYRDVLMADELPPLQSGGGGGGYYGGRYGAKGGGGGGLMPPSALPSLMHLSSAGYSPGGSHGSYSFASSPLPSFSSHNSPLHLSPTGSPVRGEGVGDDGAVSTNGPSTPQPLELYSPNISIGQLPNLAADANGDSAFGF